MLLHPFPRIVIVGYTACGVELERITIILFPLQRLPSRVPVRLMPANVTTPLGQTIALLLLVRENLFPDGLKTVLPGPARPALIPFVPVGIDILQWPEQKVGDTLALLPSRLHIVPSAATLNRLVRNRLELVRPYKQVHRPPVLRSVPGPIGAKTLAVVTRSLLATRSYFLGTRFLR